MLIQTALIFFIFLTVQGDDDCNSDKAQLAPIRLRKHLLCDYDRTARPRRDHKKPVQVFIQMIVKFYQYDVHENSFTVDSWMPLHWTDEHLKWNPEDYDSVESIPMSDSDIWMPDISVYNRRNQGGDQSAVESAHCIVSNKGLVVCVASTSHTSICTSDLTKYPFDSHNCTVRFGSWVYSGEELDIVVNKLTGISTNEVVPNGEWNLVDTHIIKHAGKYKCCPNSTYPSIDFSFKIERKARAHVASVLAPAIALTLLSLTSLWLAPTNPGRLHLCYANLLSHFFYLEYVSWMVPLNGDNIPVLLLFARDSLLLSAFIVILSYIVKSIAESETPTPAWVSRIVCVLVSFKPGQMIFLKNSSFKGLVNGQGDEDVSAIMDNQDIGAQKGQWSIFAIILDRMCFIIYVFLYGVMFLALSP